MKKIFLYFSFIFVLHIGFSQSTNAEKSFETNSSIKVFPNPATNVINILGLKNVPSAWISITDLYGNQVISHQWVIKNNALNIPIFKLEQGVYLITIQSELETVQRKFYKQ